MSIDGVHCCSIKINLTFDKNYNLKFNLFVSAYDHENPTDVGDWS